MPRPRLLAATPLLGVVLLTACPSGPMPLPEGPPPEYEPPRSYAPDKNIDGHRDTGDTPLETAPPPTDTDGPTPPPTEGGPPVDGAPSAAPSAAPVPTASAAPTP